MEGIPPKSDFKNLEIVQYIKVKMKFLRIPKIQNPYGYKIIDLHFCVRITYPDLIWGFYGKYFISLFHNKCHHNIFFLHKNIILQFQCKLYLP